MRIPLTKYGWPQVVIFPAALISIMAVCLLVGIAFLPVWAIVSAELVLGVILIWILSFFRDPYRTSPADRNLLLAPADGRITDIQTIKENDFIGGAALRIGIFLSIFNTHINRAPCNVKVEKITKRYGKYKNAANPHSGQVNHVRKSFAIWYSRRRWFNSNVVNESNDLGLVRTDSPKDRLVVRQISGSIARRIVCQIREGKELTMGEKFGMIKFGSRTELYVPINEQSCVMRDASCVTQYAILNTQYEIKCLVRIGDKVKAGLTPLIKYEKRN